MGHYPDHIYHNILQHHHQLAPSLHILPSGIKLSSLFFPTFSSDNSELSRPRGNALQEEVAKPFPLF